MALRSVEALLANLPDCDDVLRRLADVLHVPDTCRKRACRKAFRCQGGYGPPCYFADRSAFANALLEGVDEYRDYWALRRQELASFLREWPRERRLMERRNKRGGVAVPSPDIEGDD